MHCPYCSSPLIHWDKSQNSGEILICPNDETCDSETVCNKVFHTTPDKPTELKEGTPSKSHE